MSQMITVPIYVGTGAVAQAHSGLAGFAEDPSRKLNDVVLGIDVNGIIGNAIIPFERHWSGSLDMIVEPLSGVTFSPAIRQANTYNGTPAEFLVQNHARGRIDVTFPFKAGRALVSTIFSSDGIELELFTISPPGMTNRVYWNKETGDYRIECFSHSIAQIWNESPTITITANDTSFSINNVERTAVVHMEIEDLLTGVIQQKYQPALNGAGVEINNPLVIEQTPLTMAWNRKDVVLIREGEYLKHPLRIKFVDEFGQTFGDQFFSLKWKEPLIKFSWTAEYPDGDVLLTKPITNGFKMLKCSRGGGEETELFTLDFNQPVTTRAQPLVKDSRIFFALSYGNDVAGLELWKMANFEAIGFEKNQKLATMWTVPISFFDVQTMQDGGMAALVVRKEGNEVRLVFKRTGDLRVWPEEQLIAVLSEEIAFELRSRFGKLEAWNHEGLKYFSTDGGQTWEAAP